MTGALGFQALIEKSPDAIALVDTAGQVLYASASTAEVLGYRPEELLGRNGMDLLHPQDRDHSVRKLRQVAAKPQSHNRVQARLRRKDGRWLWVESTACNLLDEPHVRAIVINYREIAGRRAEERNRQRLVDELVRSNNELQSFAHTVAHDLREPLRTIAAFAQILVREAALKEANKEIGDFIIEGVRRMSSLVDELLASATRGSNDSRNPVNLEHAAAEAMQNLNEALTSSGAAITSGQLPTVPGNRCDLVRLFQNLIGNAVKYRSDPAVEVRISARRAGPDWVIRVGDNGIGIAKEHHRRIFGLFTRPHTEEIPGSGIGLAACEKIVEKMGGRIWVESEPGAGATFCFTVAALSDQIRSLGGPPSSGSRLASGLLGNTRSGSQLLLNAAEE